MRYIEAVGSRRGKAEGLKPKAENPIRAAEGPRARAERVTTCGGKGV
jgi:hypothetical protein